MAEQKPIWLLITEGSWGPATEQLVSDDFVQRERLEPFCSSLTRTFIEFIPTGKVLSIGFCMQETDRNSNPVITDLIEALEGVIRVADRKTLEFDAARAALAKAKGEN
ncbi:hypothetical protein [Dyadobacter sp. CY323]|uniref:hypothetical protein n=1 Tax=Dyadobacter sp. CY323 TaxID=2907302 RepID=UPI001F1C11F7|nr:hypothetical protein [Dyadobacter sp. CY323]MCE6993108.1 hypothetical protein [Dyadobacter sp. CY323]